MKRLIFILTMFIFITFTGCSPSRSSLGEYRNFSTIESAVKEADIIIVGKIDKVTKGEKINISSNNDEDSSFKYTVSDVSVQEVLKGDVKSGDIIKVKQLKKELYSKIAGYFKKGESYVMFLKDFRHIDPGMPMSLINPSQGKLQIKSDGTIKGSKSNIDDIKDGQTLEQLIIKIKDTVK